MTPSRLFLRSVKAVVRVAVSLITLQASLKEALPPVYMRLSDFFHALAGLVHCFR
jgi:hypothetical protein